MSKCPPSNKRRSVCSALSSASLLLPCTVIFDENFDIESQTAQSVRRWHKTFEEPGFSCNGKWSGRPRTSNAKNIVFVSPLYKILTNWTVAYSFDRFTRDSIIAWTCVVQVMGEQAPTTSINPLNCKTYSNLINKISQKYDIYNRWIISKHPVYPR